MSDSGHNSKKALNQMVPGGKMLIVTIPNCCDQRYCYDLLGESLLAVKKSACPAK